MVGETYRHAAIVRLASFKIRAAHQCLSRIEIELADHGGNDIDELPVTFNDFEELRCEPSRNRPGASRARGAWIYRHHRARQDCAREPSTGAPTSSDLLTRPWEEETEALHRPRWERFQTLEEAEAAAAEARCNAAKEKSAGAETAPKPVQKPHHKRRKASAETALLANVGNRTTIYISDGGASDTEKADLRPTSASDRRPLPLPAGWGAVI